MLVHMRLASAMVAAAGSVAAIAVPVVDPIYTYCEMEDNDRCVDAQLIDSSVAVAMSGGDEVARDCFVISGKLQEDCVWDIEPKCALRIYGKHVQCHTTNGQIIPGEFYEPLLAQSSAAGEINNFNNWGAERTIRLAIAALPDAADGTVNGLNQNTPHGEWGEVTVKVFYDSGGSDRGGAGDQSYVFRFQNHADAARVAFVIPAGVPSVDIVCCDNTGTVPVCYDVDFYRVTNLLPNRSYCATIVGGLDEFCEKTNTKLGWLDKDCQVLNTNDDVSLGNPYSELCALTDDTGILRLGVSGGRTVERLGGVDQRIAGGAIPDGPNGLFRREINVASHGPADLVQVVLENITHAWVGDLTITLTHKPSGATVALISRPGFTGTGFGSSANLNGSYHFSDFATVSIEEASVGLSGAQDIPQTAYRPEMPLSTLNVADAFGVWSLEIRDAAIPDIGELGGWRIIILLAEPTMGDCDFDGLEDLRQLEFYHFLQFTLGLTENLPGFGFRPGASTKDASVDDVNRYPRVIWDRYFEAGLPPEAIHQHGICGEYCLKVRLAEHVDPSERPTFPMITGPVAADLNRDGAINATDLATLLSFWGTVPPQ